jgi:hypothetical protein
VRDDAGEEVQATIVHRLESVWRTCLDWIRLVVPEFTRSGKPKPVTRLADDPRWALLRDVKFGEGQAIKRYRPRAAASYAQALGVALSHAGRDGRLRDELPEDVEAYGSNLKQIEARLQARLLGLFVYQASETKRWLIERYGGIAEAAVHFAVCVNAKRAKYMAGVELVLYEEARPPPLVESAETPILVPKVA